MSRTIPIIKLYDVILVSIQIELSDKLVIQLRDDITDEIRNTGANGLIIEVSGIDILDSFIARSIRDIAQIAKLMGVHTILVGLDPDMAITLVEMGLTLSGVSTALNLESAIEKFSGQQKDVKLETEDIFNRELEKDFFPELD